ncbi:MAG: hypothetical protein L6265_03270 [Thermoplasmatales archaeon]|nr:hypothetical protein [Candidatus Thermoplasmatota archaeon]MCG2825599.1 hypothetical protein [Thermoplasmatales archaeon]
MKVKCHKCGSIMDITSLERPLQVKCQVCSTVEVLKAKPPEQKQYVPPVSSTPYSPYASHPSHAPYPAQHPPYSPYPQPPAWYPEKKKTNTTLAAGVLLIIAGILAIGNSIFIILIAEEIALFSLYNMHEFLIICNTVIILLAVIAFVGGIMAIKRKSWAVALVCSILGLFIIGPLAISSLLSLIALILIAVSKEEFRQPVR